MVKKSFIIVLAAAGLISRANVVLADDKADIKALYQKFAACIKSKDADGILKLGTPDFTMGDAKGTPSPASKAVEGLKKQLAMFKAVDSCTADVTEFKVKGKAAETKATIKMALSLDLGKDMPVSKVERNSETADKIVKTNEGWKFKSITAMKVELSVNGAKVDPKVLQNNPMMKKKQ